MKRMLFALIGLSTLLSLCGCIAFMVGAGVAGGVAVSKDTAKLEIDTSYQQAWRATYDTIFDLGAISLRDEQAGKIEANVRDSSVTAQIAQVTPKSVRIEIKARKDLMPNLDLAMEIINRIHSRL